MKSGARPRREHRGLDRRVVLSGFVGAGLVGLAGVGQVRAAATARHDFAVGDVQVTVLSDGTLSLPHALVLPDTSRQELDALLASDRPAGSGFVAETNVTLLSKGGDRVLIDTGAGPNFQGSAGRLASRLEAAGIDPASITTVVLTHAHPDHLWGAIDDFDEPRFPHATYIISAAEWDYWRDPETPRRMPDGFQAIAAGATRILKLLESRIERRRPGDSVGPGILLVDTAGHTPGHLSVLVEDSGRRLLVGGDVLTHERISFERPDWTWGTDGEPERAARARAATLAMLATEDIRLLGYHLPWPGLGRVSRAGSAFRFVPEASSER